VTNFQTNNLSEVYMWNLEIWKKKKHAGFIVRPKKFLDSKTIPRTKLVSPKSYEWPMPIILPSEYQFNQAVFLIYFKMQPSKWLSNFLWPLAFVSQWLSTFPLFGFDKDMLNWGNEVDLWSMLQSYFVHNNNLCFTNKISKFTLKVLEGIFVNDFTMWHETSAIVLVLMLCPFFLFFFSFPHFLCTPLILL